MGEAKNQAWSERVRSYEYVGKSGTSSCSPTGAGGFTGCTQALLSQAYAEKGIDDTVNWGQLIEEERQNRLSRIDAREAAAEEARDRLDAKDADALNATNDLAVPPGADETPGPDDE